MFALLQSALHLSLHYIFDVFGLENELLFWLET